MSLKINVIYRGIIYRVKGIKVLCSVVLVVIILLVAIVGMGVWMLVTVYDEEKSQLNLVSNTSEPVIIGRSPGMLYHAPSIDFKNNNSDSFTTLKYDVTSQINASKVKFKDKLNIERKPAPEPNLSIFRVGLYNEHLQFDETAKENNNEVPDEVPYRNVISIDPLFQNRDTESSSMVTKVYATDSDDKIKFSFQPIREKTDIALTEEQFTPHRRLIPITYNPNVQSLTYSLKNIPQIDEVDRLQNKEPTIRIGQPIKIVDEEDRSRVDDRIYPEYEHIKVTNRAKDFSQRSGVPSSREELTYVGPPVVGYGPDPYKRISRERMDEFDSFWKTYASGETSSNLQSNLNSKEDATHLKVTMVPYLRGLRPPGIYQDPPVRPDAQVPSVDPTLHKRKNSSPRINFQPSILPHPRLRGSHPVGRPIPMQHNSDRRLYVGEQPSFPSQRIKTASRPVIPFLGPLQEMYDHSKRLAAFLLSFNTKSDDQIKETPNKLAQHGIKLIEDYSYILENAGGSLGKLSALVPTSEKLKDLDPFQLSLITWTFLDFWEFLIEKVGTLSPEDLELLQERLEKLRRRKDSVMTYALVNETMTKMTLESPRSMTSGVEIVDAVLKHTLADDQDAFEEIGAGPINVTLIQDNILKDIFPRVSVETFKKPSMEKKNDEAKNNSTMTIFEEEQNDVTTVGPPDFETETPNDINFIATIPFFLSNNSYSSSENGSVTVKENDVSNNINSSFETIKAEGRMWDPLGLFSSEGRMQFMQFAVKVVFNFGKVFLKKPYALDCAMLLFCKDLNYDTKQGGIDGMAAKVKSVGLKVLTQTDKQLREGDTLGEVWRSVTAWTPLQCEAMFPNCNGPKALEIVNEVAQGSNNL